MTSIRSRRRLCGACRRRHGAAPQAAWIAPVIRPVTSSGTGRAIGLSATLCAAPHHHDAVADGEHVGHAMADQDDRHALVASAGGSGRAPRPPGAPRSRRSARPSARAWPSTAGCGRWRPPGAGRPTSACTRSRGRVSDFSSPNSSPARSSIALWSSQRNGPDAALDLAPEEHVGRGRQIVAEREVLVDDLDALLRAPRPACGNGPARRRGGSRPGWAGNCRR